MIVYSLLEHLLRVKLMIAKHLPVLVFGQDQVGKLLRWGGANREP